MPKVFLYKRGVKEKFLLSLYKSFLHIFSLLIYSKSFVSPSLDKVLDWNKVKPGANVLRQKKTLFLPSFSFISAIRKQQFSSTICFFNRNNWQMLSYEASNADSRCFRNLIVYSAIQLNFVHLRKFNEEKAHFREGYE